MPDLKGKIEEMVVSNLEKQDLFLVDVEIAGSQAMRKIIVLIDGDSGVTVEDCARISRKLGSLLEEQGLIEVAYVLEVSSPGIDQPLKLKRQYVKNIGRRFSFTLTDGKVKTGKLEEVKEDLILIQEELVEKTGGKSKKVKLVPVEIPFNEIKKSNVLITFN
jgi:ribosome maturation factor RimP